MICQLVNVGDTMTVYMYFITVILIYILDIKFIQLHLLNNLLVSLCGDRAWFKRYIVPDHAFT